MSVNTPSTVPNASRVDTYLFQAFLLFEILLIGSTYRVWTETAFPRVPLLTAFSHPDLLLPLASLCLILVSAIVGVRSHRHRQLPSFAETSVLCLLALLPIVMSQQVLQPWHWLFVLILIGRMIVPAAEWCSLMLGLIPCIYVFAALSRLGPEIDRGMTRRIVETLLEQARLQQGAANASLVSDLCIAFTCTELLIGLSLFWPRTRRSGGILAVLMHVVLLVALGPIGLWQESAVLIWNLSLIIIVTLLFFTKRRPDRTSASRRLATGLFVLWPILALFGWADGWTGWQLYSPRTDLLQLQVRDSAVKLLPTTLQPHVEPPKPLEDWRTVRLDRWSLAETGAPLYPQARFQLAIAEAAVRDLPEDSVRGRLTTAQHIRWWRRDTREFQAHDGLSLLTETYPLYTPAVFAD